MSAVVHVAGMVQPTVPIQLCAACGYVLIDNQGWYEGRVAVVEGDDSGPTWWPVGAAIVVDGCACYVAGKVEPSAIGEDCSARGDPKP